tara:strand:+ start:3682 stop:3888 length:207 start_codon:yes stop_codon:yes gene_type:complete
MERIKIEHLGKVIVKGNQRIELTEDLNQKQILFIKNIISKDFVEVVPEVVVETEEKPKTKRKQKYDKG